MSGYIAAVDDGLAGCPETVFDGGYSYRCSMGVTKCAVHGLFRTRSEDEQSVRSDGSVVLTQFELSDDAAMTDAEQRLAAINEELNCRYSPVSTSAIDCFSDWMMRHEIDGIAYEDGLTKRDAGPAFLYAEAALLQIKIQNLEMPQP